MNCSAAGVRRRLPLTAVAVLWTALMIAPAASAQAGADEPAGFLRKHAAFSGAEFAALGRNEPVSKILQSKNGTEVAPFGAGRVNVPLDFFLEKYRDIASFKKAPEVLQIGKFGKVPAISDLDGLTLEHSEIESLRKCRVGDCAFKMSSQMIESVHRNVNWNAPDYEVQATRAYRQVLLDYVTSYLSGGNAQMVVYHDGKTPQPLARGFASIVEDSPYLAEYVPAFRDYLLRFPKTALPSSEDFVYWSKERFGYKPVVSLSHVTIYRTHDEVNRAVIASKQIYANHYFSASLGLSAFIETGAGGQGAWLLYLNRTRSDLLQGFFGGMIRFFVRRRVPEGLDKYQRQVKQKLESAYQSR
jgi:hypothetical protein